MTDRFPEALEFVLNEEGGYSNRSIADDPGGETMRGITHDTLARYLSEHPDDDMPTVLRDLTGAQAGRIYREMYWRPCKCDALPAQVALAVFNAAVQSGPVRAIKWLQRVLGVAEDGIVGSRTIAAAQARAPAELTIAYLEMQQSFEMGLSSWHSNRHGWSLRLFRTCWKAACLA